jgi:hypothetical protein
MAPSNTSNCKDVKNYRKRWSSSYDSGMLEKYYQQNGHKL